jgi:DNA processing protein
MSPLCWAEGETIMTEHQAEGTLQASRPASERAALIALWAIPGIGDRQIAKARTALQPLEELFSLKPSQAEERLGLEPGRLGRWPNRDWRVEIQELENQLARRQAQVVTDLDPGYPRALRNLDPNPPVLFVQGCADALNQPLVALVGTRKPTAYGLRMAEKFSGELIEAGWGIVSGMALGIDAQAHRAALNREAITVAVLGHGLGHTYPRAHQELRAKIAQRGAVVSEFPWDIAPQPYHFPRRNRIISGLTQGVLVVEAAERSGALITAQCAAEQGREVFALPGWADAPQSQGTLGLIQDGVKCVRSIQDILCELPAPRPAATRAHAASRPDSAWPLARRVLEACAQQALPADALQALLGIPLPQVHSAILQLQLQGALDELPGGLYLSRTAGARV